MDPIAALCFTPRIRLEIGRRNARKWIKRDDARAHRDRDRKTANSNFKVKRASFEAGQRMGRGLRLLEQRAKRREKLATTSRKSTVDSQNKSRRAQFTPNPDDEER